MALLATGALAACSSGSSGMLPTSPNTQSLAQAPSRVSGPPVSGFGMHATAHTSGGSAPSTSPNSGLSGQTTPYSKAKPMFAEAPNPCLSGTQEMPDGGGFVCDPVNANPPPMQGPTGCGTGAYNGCAPPCYTGEGGAGCVGFTGKPPQYKNCDGSKYEIGSPVQPKDNNPNNIPYYVTNISNVWNQSVIVAVIYQVQEPGNGAYYYFIQETNNGTKINWGASVGLSFGPATFTVGGGDTYDAVTSLDWFFPGQTPLPTGSGAISCWSQYPMPS